MNEEDTNLETNIDQDDSSTEGEEETSESRTYTEAELNERLAQERKDRDKRWRDRIKAASGEEGGEKSSKKADVKVDSNDNERLTRIELKAEGIKDKDIQDYLIKEANRLKKDVTELLEDGYYTSKVQEMKRDKEQELARPTPSSRTATNDRSNDLGYWLKQAEKGQLPTDGAMRRKVIAKLSGR